MGKFLIVNADDFALNEEISKGIISASEKGIVTSTSVVVNGKYFREGVNLLQDKRLDAGVHLSFVGGEKPLTGNIDGLVDDRGLFYQSFRQVVPRVLSGKYDRKALKTELFEQTSLLREARVDVTHIDSHQHLHILPGIGDIVIEIARNFNIRWIRLPRPGIFSFFGSTMNILSKLFSTRLKSYNLRFTDHFKGFELSGSINEKNLAALLNKLKEGITELIVHPGYDSSEDYDWGYGWEEELNALCSDDIKDLIKEKEIMLNRYSDLP